MDFNSPTGRVGVWVLVGYFAGIAACAKDSPTQPSQPAAPTLTAPLNDSPVRRPAALDVAADASRHQRHVDDDRDPGL